MSEMNYKDVYADIRRRYERTYIFVSFPQSEEEVLFFVESISLKNNLPILKLFSKEYGNIELNLTTAHRIRFKNPKTGVFQHNQSAMILLRKPRTQYSRGISEQNTSINTIEQNYFNKSIPYQELHSEGFVNEGVLQSAFKRQTYSVDKAIELLSSGNYASIALKNDFILSLSLQSKETTQFSLFLMKTYLGEISNKKEILFLYEKFMLNSIKKLLD